MESGKNNIVLGIVGAVGVIFVSYLLYKNVGSKSRAGHTQRRKKLSQKDQKRISHKTTKQSAQKTKGEGTSKISNGEEDPNQISFVVLERNEENQRVSSKKSDRSSDESSFDVVEAEDMEEKDGKTARERDIDESLLDDNEASVVIESEPSGMEASSSSFYHSAEETIAKDGKEVMGTVPGGHEEDSTINEEYLSQSVSQRVAAMAEKEEDGRTDLYSLSLTDSESTIIKSAESRVADAFGDVDDSSASKYTTTANIRLNRELENDIDVKPKRPTISTVSSPVKVEKSKEVATCVAPEFVGVVKDRELDYEEITAVLTAAQNTPMSVTKDQIDILVILLQKNNPTLQPTVLDCFVRVSAFTQNNANLRNAGCESVVCHQVREQCMSILEKGIEDDTLLLSLTKVLTNVSMDLKAIGNLESCVSPLIDVLIQPKTPSSVQLSILRPLINLCSQNNFHAYYTPAIKQLYALLDSSSYNIQLQSIKVLVNLSLNERLVPHMLSAKAPDSLLNLLDKPTHADVILRALTMISNLRATIGILNIDQSSLPSVNKAESPKTMYTALCGVVKAPLLRNKVYRLTRHSEEDIRLQASKLYNLITVVKK